MADYQIFRIMATNCCVCGAALADSESVENSIGPVCSKRYYNPKHVPTAVQVQLAIGHLAASELPEEVIDAFLRIVNNDHVNARLGCNLLVKYASIHYNDRDSVFKCSPIIRALGYTELSDKLENDRTSVTVNIVGDLIEVYVPNRHVFERDLKGIPGAQPMYKADGAPVKIGQKVGWSMSVDQKDHVYAVLGVHCGGELACGTNGIYRLPHRRWSDVMDFRRSNGQAPAKQQGGVVQLLPKPNGKMEIHSPYNAGFVSALKASIPYQQRSWTGACWLITVQYLDITKNLIQVHYGVAV